VTTARLPTLAAPEEIRVATKTSENPETRAVSTDRPASTRTVALSTARSSLWAALSSRRIRPRRNSPVPNRRISRAADRSPSSVS
jgi:hypothetical protein